MASVMGNSYPGAGTSIGLAMPAKPAIQTAIKAAITE